MNFNYLSLGTKRLRASLIEHLRDLSAKTIFQGANVGASLHGCLLGNNQLKVSCWEDGFGRNILKISTAGGIVFPEVIASQHLTAVEATKYVFVTFLQLKQDRQ
jgi:hypothetical protein